MITIERPPIHHPAVTPAELRDKLVALLGDGGDFDLAHRAAPILHVAPRSIMRWLQGAGNGGRQVPKMAMALLDARIELKERGHE